mmetsp:Transcript_4167/g.12679  ORF Transcript_4167/g.12679 Transcript_4167/m.12679 type:complete len:714 (-) Transcript_4167:72-2213(-)
MSVTSAETTALTALPHSVPVPPSQYLSSSTGSTVDNRTRQLQAISSDYILRQCVDPCADLARERRLSSFSPSRLSDFLFGKGTLERERELTALLANDPVCNKKDRYFLSKKERYLRNLKISVRLAELVVGNGVMDQDERRFMYTQLGDPLPTDLHFAMFIPTIKGQGSQEQQDKWLPLAMTFQIWGTYAQTELGHGTYIRGLETTATYDKETQEFVIHTPTLTATKWWPGGLAKTSTHAVVMARLMIDGKDFGPHAFVIQLRSMTDHTPLPGIKVGDIGPKFGFMGIDNGFLSFNYVRVPRDALLMKYVTVTPEGEYRKPEVAKASYGTMIYVRSIIVKGAFSNLAKATTIAVRYAAVRRQTATHPGKPETQVLDYQNLQYTLFPLVASAYALHFTGNYMMDMYNAYMEAADEADYSALPVLHGTSAGLKALCTWMTAEGIELCRQCCGGHGYSHLSGLPDLYQNYVGAITYEGENNVMCLQTARFLLKSLKTAEAGKSLSGQVSYLSKMLKSRCEARADEDFMRPELQLLALEHRAKHLVLVADSALKTLLREGLSEAEARNRCAVDLIRASKAHCYYVMAFCFRSAIDKAKSTAPMVADFLERMCHLFILHTIEKDLGDFLENGHFSAAHAQMVRRVVRQLCTMIRPDAVAYVDAFGMSDYFLNSALGRYDGDVYCALYEWAQHARLNKSEVSEGYAETMRQFTHKEQARL